MDHRAAIAEAEGGLLWRMLSAWADLRGAMRAELDRRPSEGRLLFYVMLSGLIWFLGRAAVLSWGPLAPTLSESEYLGRMAAEFASAMTFRTLAFYLVAAVAGAVARAAGGTGSWRDSRAAVFWAALVAAPAILAAGLLSLLLTAVPGQAAPIASSLGALAFAWTLAFCLAEAHGFRRWWLVLIVLAALIGSLVFAFSRLLVVSMPAQAAPLAGLSGAAAMPELPGIPFPQAG